MSRAFLAQRYGQEAQRGFHPLSTVPFQLEVSCGVLTGKLLPFLAQEHRDPSPLLPVQSPAVAKVELSGSSRACSSCPCSALLGPPLLRWFHQKHKP